MKTKDITIGGTYAARVSGNFVHVRVVRVKDTPESGKTRFVCRNLQTGREIVATAARLRKQVHV